MLTDNARALDPLGETTQQLINDSESRRSTCMRYLIPSFRRKISPRTKNAQRETAGDTSFKVYDMLI